MSLRPEISGFSLAQMQSHFSSHNRAVLAYLDERLAQSLEAVADEGPQAVAEYQRTFETAAQRAVNQVVPFRELEVEGQAYVDLAIELSRYQQEHLPTDSNQWKMFVFEDFLAECGDDLSPEARALVGYFTTGRALFGHRIETGWSYYGYLTLEEVRLLATELEKLTRADESVGSEQFLDGFVGEFHRWLRTIADRGLDLWFYTA